MKRNLRLAAYIGVGLALGAVMLAQPAAWAAPSQRTHGQTVPTRGPTPTFAVTFAPTEAPTAQPTQPPATEPPAERPSATPEPGATAAPVDTTTLTPVPTVTNTPAPAVLLLTKEADRTVVWPGLDVTFTLMLVNRGTSSVRDVVVEDALPAELIAGSVQGSGATWDGRTLHARTSLLPPGGRLVVIFTAQVRDDAAAGGIIVNQAAATATGSQRAVAGVVLVLPPAELPPTGADAAPVWVESRAIFR